MDKNIVKTFWQPQGAGYCVEHVTTIEEAKKYHADWIDEIKPGVVFIQHIYAEGTVPNPGTLTVVLNVMQF